MVLGPRLERAFISDAAVSPFASRQGDRGLGRSSTGFVNVETRIFCEVASRKVETWSCLRPTCV